MKNIMWMMVLGLTVLFGEFKQVDVTPDFFKKGITVIDIRTPGEWRQTGIVKGAKTIMFFDERGGYDIPAFLRELNKYVKKDEPFALICHTGSRTATVSDFLSKELGYKVINLRGGMECLVRQGYQPVPYKK